MPERTLRATCACASHRLAGNVAAAAGVEPLGRAADKRGTLASAQQDLVCARVALLHNKQHWASMTWAGMQQVGRQHH